MTTKKTPRTQQLICCCCGQYTRGRQWFNRDKGFGVCPSCAQWMEDRREDVEAMCGRYGYHHSLVEAI